MQPNIVIFHMDDQRHDTIAALGNPQIETPNMDWLVQHGTAFTHAFNPGGTCPALCMPSRAMMHTGHTLFHLEKDGGVIPDDHTLLGEAFRKAGYHTFGCGKWHNGAESFHRSFADGAEVFFGGMTDHWNVPACHYDPSGKYAARTLQIEDPKRSNKTTSLACDHIHAGKHSTDLFAEASVKFLKSHPTDSPYLLYTAFLAPHDPRSMPDRYLALYDPAQIQLPANFMEQHPFDNGELRVRDECLASFPRTESEIRTHLAEYYAMITHLDERIGEIMNAVRERGDFQNTIFVLSADHGLAIGQHGLMGKQSLYDHSIRVPLLFCGPGIAAGVESDAMVLLCDVMPTLCTLTGTAVPDGLDGIDLTEGREAIYLAYMDKHRGIRTRQHKLIEYVVDGNHTMTQLFDLQQDPAELHNLVDEPKHQILLNELREKMTTLRDQSGDNETQWGQTFWIAYEKRPGCEGRKCLD